MRAGWPPPDIDKECVALCEAMNALPGIRTIESCCGHGERPFRIWFKTARLRNLPRLLYWFNGCHSAVYGWTVQVTTDCGMSPATFCATTEAMGEQAFQEANEIAEAMRRDDR